MALRDNIGTMVKAIGGTIATFAISQIFSICWLSYFLTLTNNSFFKVASEGKSLNNWTEAALILSVLSFVFMCLIGILMYFCGNYRYIHLSLIFLFIINLILEIIFFILMLVQSSNKKEESFKAFYSDQFQNPERLPEVTIWMTDNNCSTDCNDKLQSYLHKRYSVGFIVTGLNLLFIILPILALLIILLVMATIRPQEESDDVGYVPSNLENSIISAKRYLTHELLSDKL